jgi:hypothetical protein
MLASPLFPGPCYCFLAVAVLPAASDVPAPVSPFPAVAALGGVAYVPTVSAVPTIAGILVVGSVPAVINVSMLLVLLPLLASLLFKLFPCHCWSPCCCIQFLLLQTSHRLQVSLLLHVTMRAQTHGHNHMPFHIISIVDY